jgi:hypothetical protein
MTCHALFSMTCYAMPCIALPRLTNPAPPCLLCLDLTYLDLPGLAFLCPSLPYLDLL